MTEYPWETPVETNDDTFTSDEKNGETYDPCKFLRLRIQHGSRVRFVAIRADDNDITGRIPLDNDSVIVVSLWGIPTRDEIFMKSDDVLREIIKYVSENGLAVK